MKGVRRNRDDFVYSFLALADWHPLNLKVTYILTVRFTEGSGCEWKSRDERYTGHKKWQKIPELQPNVSSRFRRHFRCALVIHISTGKPLYKWYWANLGDLYIHPLFSTSAYWQFYRFYRTWLKAWRHRWWKGVNTRPSGPPIHFRPSGEVWSTPLNLGSYVG